MKVLVVGSGGREHALAWKIAQSPLATRVYCAPGNPGIASVADNVDISSDDIQGLLRFANQEAIDLTVVGPEAPLCAGIVDAFKKAGRLCFGPDKAAAELEGSKAFARQLCQRHRIPGPGFWTFDNLSMARSFVDNRPDGPIVVKASGLAAGKGVAVCKNNAEARVAVTECLEQRRFGEAGRTVVFEEFLEGPEVSLITLTDGETIVPLEPARDHKPVGDGDTGPNTGGMGVVTPVALMPRMLRQIETQVVFPTVHAMNREKRRYQGFLYAGLMLTTQGPRVLEYNCRLGDPETQPLLMRLKSDLLPLLLATAEGKLSTVEAPEWDSRVAVCVVACSGGYPGDYKKGVPIFGVDRVATGADLQVFHAGTQQRGGDLLTAGGRVLAVTALGDDLHKARDKAYAALKQIEFAGMHYRKDIGLGAAKA
ncbi:MAG: phosphoribosylamine--glycine ligase [Planctomycetes bacterium]|nr:phosphoribosylamine--glycine ligase [Planctomycetota bacterium]